MPGIETARATSTARFTSSRLTSLRGPLTATWPGQTEQILQILAERGVPAIVQQPQARVALEEEKDRLARERLGGAGAQEAVPERPDRQDAEAGEDPRPAERPLVQVQQCAADGLHRLAEEVMRLSGDFAEGRTDIPPLEGRVSFESVSFAYKGGQKVLEDFSLEGYVSAEPIKFAVAV